MLLRFMFGSSSAWRANSRSVAEKEANASQRLRATGYPFCGHVICKESDMHRFALKENVAQTTLDGPKAAQLGYRGSS